jgi:hypothetical protein
VGPPPIDRLKGRDEGQFILPHNAKVLAGIPRAAEVQVRVRANLQAPNRGPILFRVAGETVPRRPADTPKGAVTLGSEERPPHRVALLPIDQQRKEAVPCNMSSCR